MTALVSRLITVVATLAAVTSAGGQGTGTIVGTVRSGATPIADARVFLDATLEARTDSAGGFTFRNVRAGEHSLDVRSLGSARVVREVTVKADETARPEFVLEKITTLDSVVVEGSTVRQGFVKAFEDRKRMGVGKFLDSTEVKKFAKVDQALLFVPGVRRSKGREPDYVFFSDRMGIPCLPNVWIDNQNWGMEQGVLRTMSPDNVAAVEVYTRETLIPDEFRQRGREKGCGALVIWTKRFWPEKGKPPRQ